MYILLLEIKYCSLSLRQLVMMTSSADHRDLSVVCQAQAYQIVGQQKSGPLQSVRGAGADVLAHPPPYGPDFSQVLFETL